MIADPCCQSCRTPYGTCSMRHECEHHVIAAARQRIEDKRPTIQYRDPVGNQAAARADRSRRKQRKP